MSGCFRRVEGWRGTSCPWGREAWWSDFNTHLASVRVFTTQFVIGCRFFVGAVRCPWGGKPIVRSGCADWGDRIEATDAIARCRTRTGEEVGVLFVTRDDKLHGRRTMISDVG